MSLSAIRIVMFAALGALGWLALKASADRAGFPHDTHEGLFPTCNACHAGAAAGDDARMYTVTPADCAACHDGDTIDRVRWSGPAERPANLVFDHALHARELEIACADCHGDPESGSRMAVVRPAPDTCFECHEGTSHMVDAECALCHRPVAEAKALTAETIAAFPRPADHDAEDFLFGHGVAAAGSTERCAVCHTAETCSTCHLNAAALAPVRDLGSDARLARQAAAIDPRWPLPESHESELWLREHGAAARADIENCANCHVQNSCTGCHGEIPPPGLGALPVATPAGPRGVELAGVRPPGHDADFYFHHGAEAAVSDNCMSCHDPGTCENCHAGQSKPGFHPANYIFRHRAEAYAGDLECANCHSSETFCRACHENTGLSAPDARSWSFHDADPLWLLSHGNAARQGLDTCASCHQQNDCMRCHSAKTGWRVNPHGPGFDPNRLGDRSLLLCSRCHFSDPRPR